MNGATDGAEHVHDLVSAGGCLGGGCDADLVVFDASSIEDRATYLEPYLEALGVDHVVVGGSPVIRNGQFGDARPGLR